MEYYLQNDWILTKLALCFPRPYVKNKSHHNDMRHKYYLVAIVIFYTEILSGKVVLLCFFSSEMSEKIHNSTF